MSKTRVAVLYGGRSGEHEISIRSAKSIMAALDRSKYEVIEYIISKEGKWADGRILRPEPGGNPDIDAARDDRLLRFAGALSVDDLQLQAVLLEDTSPLSDFRN